MTAPVAPWLRREELRPIAAACWGESVDAPVGTPADADVIMRAETSGWLGGESNEILHLALGFGDGRTVKVEVSFAGRGCQLTMKVDAAGSPSGIQLVYAIPGCRCVIERGGDREITLVIDGHPLRLTPVGQDSVLRVKEAQWAA